MRPLRELLRDQKASQPFDFKFLGNNIYDDCLDSDSFKRPIQQERFGSYSIVEITPDFA